MKIAIFGATSGIAQETARALISASKENLDFILLGRDAVKCDIVAKDLTVRGASDVTVLIQDLDDVDAMDELVTRMWQESSGLDIVLIAHGVLPDQTAIENSWEGISDAIKINALSPIAIMTAFAKNMEAQKHGKIVVISSVAGDRGRASNYVYGTAKGAVTLFAQGLRNRLSGSGVEVLTVKPGFVDTAMTAHLDKGGMLWADAEKVGTLIAKASLGNKDVLWAPWFWGPIMMVIRCIPERIFKKLSL